MDDKEVGRWQQAIYELCCKAVEGLREARTIDGAGCNSGDCLDFSLAEISQAVCSLRDEIDLLTHERNEAQERAGEAWVAGCWLAEELMATTDLWLLLAKDFGDMYLELKQAEEERNEVQAEIRRLQEWIMQRRPAVTCDNNTGNGWTKNPPAPYWGEPDSKDDCGECVPCKARAALGKS